MSSVNLSVSSVRPARAGREYFWTTLLEASRNGGSMTVKELRGLCNPDQNSALQSFIARMQEAGFVERLGDRAPYAYRIIRPQRDCPIITGDGKPALKGLAQQYMWNVMRRCRGGFTIEQLMIDGSTDDVIVGQETARSYVGLLVRAGIVKVTRKSTTISEREFVLTGTGNTGAKAPRRMRAAFMFDPNTCSVIGEVLAEEERT